MKQEIRNEETKEYEEKRPLKLKNICYAYLSICIMDNANADLVSYWKFNFPMIPYDRLVTQSVIISYD